MANDVEAGPYPSTSSEPSARLCNFATGSSVLLASHKTWIASTLASAVQAAPLMYVQAAGLASRLGAEAANQKLAAARGKAVIDYLESVLGKSLMFADVGSYGESMSAGKANDNDGFYRGVLVSASPNGFEPPRPEHIPVFGELRRRDEQMMQEMRKKEMQRIWIGAGVKAGGTAILAGLEDTEGVVVRADTFRTARYVGISSFRAGLGIGISGNPVVLIMFNTTDPSVFDGRSTSDWGVNLSLGPNWGKLAKGLTQYRFFEVIGRVAKLGWQTATPDDLEALRNALHILYSSLGAAGESGPGLLCLDVPVGGVGAEVSVVATWGTIRVR
jgi:hypothetical protein